MRLTKQDYIPRIIDATMEKYLGIFGAISIEGPKWCGKTWTGLNHAESVTYMTDKSSRELAKVEPRYIFTDKRPQLIDEWQLVPSIWDAVRNECDASKDKGKFILTGSTTLTKTEGEDAVFHSGTGRIATLKMYPMSLYESGDSDGRVSISGLCEGIIREGHVEPMELWELAGLIIRGGWPANIDVSDPAVIPASYIESVVTKDIHEREDKKRDPKKMRMLLRSLARNESSIASNETLVRDIEEYESGEGLIESRQTVAEYLGVLESLYLICDQEAFSTNYRPSSRIGKAAKRHLVDPSLACSSLGLTVEKMMGDLRTFGLMFESLVERDLRVYIESLGGHLYHFRDNTSGDEVDAILEFPDGEYAAVEIKLSDDRVPEALRSLKVFYDKAGKKPLFTAVILGRGQAVMREPENGIYIFPITSLKP